MEYTLHRRTIEHQGISRKYIVVEPSTLDAGRGCAPNLLIYFHGSQQSGSVSRRFTNGTFDDMAQRTGTLLVYPDGYHNHFNDARGILPAKAREEGIDDVAFTQLLVTTLREEYGVGNVYACGYSNGGQMTLRLLFDAPGLLSGAAVFCSTLGAGDNHAPTNPDSMYEPTPVMMIAGTDDPITPFGGGAIGAGTRHYRGEVLSAPATAARLAELNGASASDVSRPYPDVSVTRYGGANPVELWAVEGMGHLVPCGKTLDPRLGTPTESFLAADAVAAFFGFEGPAASCPTG